MSTTRPRETDLYLPVKTLLEGQGYEVKGEIGAADVVGVRGDEDPVVVELKTSFSLSLFHQAIERQAITDAVYIAVPRGSGRAAFKALGANKSLCRRLGLGLITVRLKDGLVEVHADPSPYKPRKSALKKGPPAPRICQTNRRSELWRGDTAGPDDRLPAGCAALRPGAFTARSDQGGRGCQTVRRRKGPNDDGRQSLWLVREGGDRHLFEEKFTVG
jgi:hypothetical protein